MAVEADLQPATTSPQLLHDPRQVYTERLEQRQKRARHFEQTLDRLGLARLAVFGVGLVVGWLAFYADVISAWWLAVPAGLFFALLIYYQRVRRAAKRAGRAIRYYEFGLDRLDDRWHGKGHSGQHYLDDQHLYALDLDIFGEGSLFERLCSTRTRPGEATLADWLRQPAAPEEIEHRHEAIGELRGRLDLREDLALLGAEVPPVDFGALQRWAKSAPVLPSLWLRIVVFVLSLVNLVAVTRWFIWIWAALQEGRIVWGWPALPVAGAFLVSGSLALWLSGRVKRVLEPIEPMGRDLFLLANILERIEREPFSTPTLVRLQSDLRVDGNTPSVQINKLAFLVDWLNAMKNQFFIPLGLVLMWHTQMAFAIEAWRKRSGPVIEKWLNAIGAIEALSSLAGYAYENPEDTFPEVAAGDVCFDGENLGHPLLPKSQCVRNDVQLVEPIQAMIVSGSNMSGKSTLLRSVGTNAILALAGAPVRADRLKLTPLAIGATLRIQDSLLAGKSRFFAEISRIQAIIKKSDEELPVLFLLDELFHGTNSHDRCIGAEALLNRLLSAGAIGLLTTHDLTLTKIAERLGDHVRNVHFADQFVDGQMHFDYTIRPGVVPHSNALSLMRAIGLEV